MTIQTYVSVTDGYFSVLDTDDVEFKVINEYDDSRSRFTTNFDLIDYNRIVTLSTLRII